MKQYQVYDLSLLDKMQTLQLHIVDEDGHRMEEFFELPKKAFDKGSFTTNCRESVVKQLIHRYADKPVFNQIKAIIHYNAELTKVACILRNEPEKILECADRVADVSQIIRTINEEGIKAFVFYKSANTVLKNFGRDGESSEYNEN